MIDDARIRFLDCDMNALTMEQTLAVIEARLQSGVFTQHCVVNVAKLVNMRKDPLLAESVLSCDIVNIDGMGVVLGARLAGLEVPERVAGIDLMHRLLALAALRGWPVFMLGAKEDVVRRATDEACLLYPGLTVAGYHHGYFWADEQQLVEKVRASGARLLFVAITSPLKESFIARHSSELGVGFVMGVGGSFDHLAGDQRRAPEWMQRAGLEWFHRMLSEPKRLGGRYLITNGRYAALMVPLLFRRLCRSIRAGGGR